MNDRGNAGKYDSTSSSIGSSGMLDFTRISQAIGTNIQKINSNVSQMQSLLSGVDSSNSDDQLLNIQHNTNQLAKDTNKLMRDLTQMPAPYSPSEQKQQKLQKERLLNEFTKALNGFQAVQRKEKEREKANVARVKSSPKYDPFSESKLTFDENPDAIGYRPQPQQTFVQMEVSETDVEIMMEREEALRKLERDIVDVNQIFKDLGMMVHEQGDVIDSIEANVEVASASVEQGTDQLRQARDHQSKARKKKCIIITIVVIILALVIIIPVAIYAPKN